MKKLTCEMCGSADLMKQDGVFVCQTCGCKYSVEEARKMMVEGNIDVSGSTVKVDSTDFIENYHQLAELAFEDEEYAAVEKYANKIIEKDAKEYRAWFLKGTAAGWQPHKDDDLFKETVINWRKAFQFAPKNKKEELALEIQLESKRMSNEILDNAVSSFKYVRSRNSRYWIDTVLYEIDELLKYLAETFNVDVSSIKNNHAQIIHSGTLDASNEVDKYLGNPTKFEEYADQQYRCLHLLSASYCAAHDDDLCCTICKDAIAIAEAVWALCPSNYYTEEIDLWKKRLEYCDMSARQNGFDYVIKKCNSCIGNLEETFTFSSYWEQHAVEKAYYEKEKKSLAKQIDHLKKSKLALPLYIKKKSIEDNINSLNYQIKSLGIFKIKEKKALQEKIEVSQAELKETITNLQASEAPFDAQIKSLESYINKIVEELTMSRGRMPISHRQSPLLFVPGEKKLAMSPINLLEFVRSMKPVVYGHNTVEGENNATYINVKLDEWFIKNHQETETYRIDFYEGKNWKKTTFLCYAKSTKDLIEGNLCFRLSDDFTPDEAFDFVMLISPLIFDMFPSIDMGTLHRFLAAGIYGIDETQRFTSDGLKIEVNRNKTVTFTISPEHEQEKSA